MVGVGMCVGVGELVLVQRLHERGPHLLPGHCEGFQPHVHTDNIQLQAEAHQLRHTTIFEHNTDSHKPAGIVGCCVQGWSHEQHQLTSLGVDLNVFLLPSSQHTIPIRTHTQSDGSSSRPHQRSRRQQQVDTHTSSKR